MSDNPSPLAEAITEAAARPAQVASDGLLVQQRPLGELIEADKHLQNQQAAASPRRGLRVTKLLPPGAV